jgi:hypothetical protein
VRSRFFGNTYKYDFANLNFNKNPMALNFYNTNFVGSGWAVDAVKMAKHGRKLLVESLVEAWFDRSHSEPSTVPSNGQ